MRLGATSMRTRGLSARSQLTAPRTRFSATATSSAASSMRLSAWVRSLPATRAGPVGGSARPANAPRVASRPALAWNVASSRTGASGFSSAPRNLPCASPVAAVTSMVHGVFAASSVPSAPSVAFAVCGWPAWRPCTSTAIGPPARVSAVTALSLSASGGFPWLYRQRKSAPCAVSFQFARATSSASVAAFPSPLSASWRALMASAGSASRPLHNRASATSDPSARTSKPKPAAPEVKRPAPRYSASCGTRCVRIERMAPARTPWKRNDTSIPASVSASVTRPSASARRPPTLALARNFHTAVGASNSSGVPPSS